MLILKNCRKKDGKVKEKLAQNIGIVQHIPYSD
jgi:DNA-binding XRE family transcriptional regulator